MAEPGDNKPILTPEQAMLERARARHGSIGAIVFSGMLGIDKLLGRKPKDEGAVVWEASGDPEDIDSDGILIELDEQTSVVSNPAAHREPRRIRKRRSVK